MSRALHNAHVVAFAKELSKFDPYYVMFLVRSLKLRDLDAVFATSAAASRIAKKYDLQYDGWYVE